MLLVLENYWDDDLSDTTSVYPFIDGWARLNDIKVGYRRYHNSYDLNHWIKEFTRHKQYNLCYIAGHGSNGRLCGINEKINLDEIAKVTKQRNLKRTVPQKGIFFGACEVGQRLEPFLGMCGDKIKWVGGYTCTVPWIESTLCDIKLLQYYYQGRVDRARNNGQNVMLLDANKDITRTPTRSYNKIYQWMSEDYPMSEMFGLRIFYRS